MDSVIIAVLVVLGIIVAGGFLLYFLGDLLMGISGKKKDVDAIREKQLKQQKELEERVNALENAEEARKDPEIATVLYGSGNGQVEAYNPDEEEEEETVEETPVEEEAVEEETSEETETEEDDDTTEYIRQRRKELLERLAKMQEEREAEEEEEDVDDTVDLTEEEEEPAEEEPVNLPEEEPVEEETEEPAQETPVEEPVEETPAEEPAEETTTEETPDEDPQPTVVVPIVTETEEVAKQVEEEIAEEKMEEAKAAGTNALASNFTLEELEARLAEEQEKLKNNEKELRKCKKEFIPLRRVKNTLESDEKKLRRKEALVAKQKVVLYGVNNYSDIDNEKAQKLAEDLDLLDGLKLSVQHCQEVMDKNQERYPLLEQIFTLLSSQNETIKDDIKKLQDAIAQLKGEQGGEE